MRDLKIPQSTKMRGQTGLRTYLNRVRRDPQGYPKVRQWPRSQQMRKCLVDEQLHDGRSAEETRHKMEKEADDTTELEDIQTTKKAPSQPESQWLMETGISTVLYVLYNASYIAI